MGDKPGVDAPATPPQAALEPPLRDFVVALLMGLVTGLVAGGLTVLHLVGGI